MTRKSSPASTIRKAVLLAGVCTLVLVVILRYQSYQNIVKQAERLTLTTLEHAAWSAAQAIDGDVHQQLQQAFLEEDHISALSQEERYDQLHLKLALIQKAQGFETPIYTYTKAEGTNRFDFIVTSSPEPYYRHPFTSAPKEQIASYGTAGSLPVYTDTHGKWLSAFTPIYNSTGDVVAMLQVDQCFDQFIDEAEKEAFAGIWWNVLLVLFLVAMVWKYVTVLIYKEEEDKIALQKIIQEKTALYERLALREKELEEQKVLLVNKNQYLEDFANIASHDLKSPLRGIASFASLLSRRLGSTAESSVTEYVTYIQSNAKRALSLVDGILSYSKVGDDAQKNAPCNLNEVTGFAIDNLQSVIQNKEAHVEISNTLPNAICDQVLVTQLFQNLINNGIKYNESKVPKISITSSIDEGGDYIFSVNDNGIGIPKEYQDSVFEMFKRLHGAGDKYEGSGIGLAFCARIVASYEGRIWLESVEGEGSTFFFTMPGAFEHATKLA